MKKRSYYSNLKNPTANRMLKALAEYYGVEKDEVVELLVRLMYKVHFGGRLYPELELEFGGYNSTLVGLIVEEARAGGHVAGKVLNKMTLLPNREMIEQVVKSAKENDLTINALREEFLERQDIADERMDENGDDFYVENS